MLMTDFRCLSWQADRRAACCDNFRLKDSMLRAEGRDNNQVLETEILTTHALVLISKFWVTSKAFWRCFLFCDPDCTFPGPP